MEEEGWGEREVKV